MPDVPTTVTGICACFVPHVPFGLMYGGGEVQAESTMNCLSATGHQAFWIDVTDHDLLEHTDVLSSIGACITISPCKSTYPLPTCSGPWE